MGLQGYISVSFLPPTPHVFLARHRTKAKVFYFNFREATSLFSPLGSTKRHQVKKALTEEASPPSIAEERKGREDSRPSSPAPSPSSLQAPRCLGFLAPPSSTLYLSLAMEGCLALIRVDPQGNIGIQVVQLLGVPHHQVILPNLQRQPQSSILRMHWNQPTLPLTTTE